MKLENMNPTDVRWKIIKNVYDRNVVGDIKTKLINSSASVIMLFCLSCVPALKFDNDEELLEIENRLYKYHLESKEW